MGAKSNWKMAYYISSSRLSILSCFLIVLTSPLLLSTRLASSSSTMLNVTTTTTGSKNVAAVFAFGDSVLDTGNNNYVYTTLLKCNFPPYGTDFPRGGKPTGRCSNGKLVSDLIAEDLGVKEYLPPYLDPNLQAEDLVTGVCFASAGSGHDPETLKITSAISIPDQLKLFEQYIARLSGLVGEQRSIEIVTKSLYLISSANNDIGITYSITKYTKYDITLYATFLVTQATATLEQLYKMGARKIVVLSPIVVGCIPAIRTIFGGTKRSCVESYNELVRIYNEKLSSEIEKLNTNLYGVNIAFVDIYTPIFDIIHNPGENGFVNVNEGVVEQG